MRTSDVSAAWKVLGSERKIFSLETLEKISQEAQIGFVYIFTIIWSCIMLTRLKYSDTSANEDNSFRNYIH